MNAKKTVASFIRPNWIPVVILLLVPYVNIVCLLVLLFSTLPALSRANKQLKKLEAEGKLQTVAAQLSAGDSKRYMNGKIVLTANYVICRRRGYIFSYDELAWAYKHIEKTTFLFIPINTTESIYLATRSMRPTKVVSMGKDKTGEIKNALLEIYNHNRNCLIGYNNENQAQYKALKLK